MGFSGAIGLEPPRMLGWSALQKMRTSAMPDSRSLRLNSEFSMRIALKRQAIQKPM